ncbi:hypothetical protein EDB82DRAFT_476099 [Fusarium venenatum]|uniref:uncharacterized protein n=1 Tax=Fusarium venenatum TaxID=56646 RepID=UPI001D425B2D|nr:hypothetical protein EDB82DRAFT_476099 [Fusarium venenatum]
MRQEVIKVKVEVGALCLNDILSLFKTECLLFIHGRLNFFLSFSQHTHNISTPTLFFDILKIITLVFIAFNMSRRSPGQQPLAWYRDSYPDVELQDRRDSEADEERIYELEYRTHRVTRFQCCRCDDSKENCFVSDKRCYNCTFRLSWQPATLDDKSLQEIYARTYDNYDAKLEKRTLATGRRHYFQLDLLAIRINSRLVLPMSAAGLYHIQDLQAERRRTHEPQIVTGPVGIDPLMIPNTGPPSIYNGGYWANAQSFLRILQRRSHDRSQTNAEVWLARMMARRRMR